MDKLVNELREKIDSMGQGLSDPKLRRMLSNCFINTLKTTTEVLDDGTSYVFTGDIPAMWLRDSTAQVKQYFSLINESDDLKNVIKGLVKRQFMYIEIDPYANSFNKEPNSHGHNDKTESGPWVWERKYEIDSLCYPMELCHTYWKTTGDDSLFDDRFLNVAKIIVDLWIKEQRHGELSNYSFEREDCAQSDTLPNEGRGMPVNYTGMIWSAFRPSDDACKFGYLVPANMFAVVALTYIEEIVGQYYPTETVLLGKIAKLRHEIDLGIQTYGKYLHPVHGEMYAYETDGFGNYHLMDDANVPSLMSIPYLGYVDAEDKIYKNTRSFVLSSSNPFYYEGKYAKGVGSPHTPEGYFWPIGLSMQGLTSNSIEEIEGLIETLVATDAGTEYMHEGVECDNPNNYTREWFAWSNSLFSELVIKYIGMKK